jgi:hypothetical protein
MREPGVDAAPARDDTVAITENNVFLPAGRRKVTGPDVRPALLTAAAGAAVLAIAAVLLRHLKFSLEPGFTDSRQIGEMAAWALAAAAAAGLVLHFAIAPGRGLKMRAPHYLTLGALVLMAAAIAATWIGFPSAQERMHHKVLVIAAQARDDSVSDIIAFQSQARALEWVSRLSPDAIDKELNLPALRTLIANSDDAINDFKTRLAKRRQNIATLLDVAAGSVDHRQEVQTLYERMVGDLALQEDRYWDLQAQAVDLGCRLIDGEASLRAWSDYQRQGYQVMINRKGFTDEYAVQYGRLTHLRDLLSDTVKAVNRPVSNTPSKA